MVFQSANLQNRTSEVTIVLLVEIIFGR